MTRTRMSVLRFSHRKPSRLKKPRTFRARDSGRTQKFCRWRAMSDAAQASVSRFRALKARGKDGTFPRACRTGKDLLALSLVGHPKGSLMKIA